MKPLKIEIVTPVHDRREETMQCLKSISRSVTEGSAVHVIVVDDGSTDGTADAIRADFPDVEIVVGNGDLWYTAGTNRGIEAALKHAPDYVLAINNDIILDENCIIRMLECAGQHPRSVIGALLLNREEPHKVFQVSPRWEFWSGGYRHWLKQTVWTVPQKPWQVDIIVGNCVLYPVQAIREAGLMDETKLPQYGDAEYTPRMRRMGWRLLIAPKARVFCKPNDQVAGFKKMSLSSMIKHLFVTTSSPYSIRRRLYMNMKGARHPIIGLLALPVFYIRVLIGRNIEGDWARTVNEKPLSETFASAVIDD